MDPDSELKPKIGMEVVSANIEKASVQQDPEDGFMHCANNYEDHNFEEETLAGGQVSLPDKDEDMEVNITECTNSGEHGLSDGASQDMTENSSSFGDTVSGAENGLILSDAEVESPCYGNSSFGLVFDRFDRPLQKRKKKLTDHWRRFIHPLMWRCKWMELQLKEFRAQTLKYDRELAEYDQKKQFEFEKFSFEGFHAKSQPFSCQVQRKKVMKRKKRRSEETTDIGRYMFQHNLFSYYESKKKSDAKGATVGDARGNLDKKIVKSSDDFGLDAWTSLGFRDDDNYYMQILMKLEGLQSHISKLIGRMKKVKNEINGKFSSINSLTPPAQCDALADSSNCGSHPENGVSSRGEVIPVSDMIESIGLHRLRGLSENIEEEILIHNEAAMEELRNFESGMSQKEEPRIATEVVTSGGNLPSNPNISMPSVKPNEGSPSTSKSKVSNNKRKRGKRKSGSGRRSRR